MEYNIKLYVQTSGLTWDGVPVSVREIKLEGERIDDILFQLIDKGSLYLHRVVKIEITEPDVNIVKKDNGFFM